MFAAKENLEKLKEEVVSFGNISRNDGFVYSLLGEVLGSSEINSVNQDINNLYLRNQRARSFIKNSTIFIRSLIDDHKLSSCWEESRVWIVSYSTGYQRKSNFSASLSCIKQDSTVLQTKIQHFLLSEKLQKISNQVISETSIKDVIETIVNVSDGLVDTLNPDDEFFENLKIKKEVYGTFSTINFEIPVFTRPSNLFRMQELPMWTNKSSLFQKLNLGEFKYFLSDGESNYQMLSKNSLEKCQTTSDGNFKCKTKSPLDATSGNEITSCVNAIFLDKDYNCKSFVKTYNISKMIWYQFKNNKYFYASPTENHFYLMCSNLVPRKIKVHSTGLLEISESCYIQTQLFGEGYTNITDDIGWNEFITEVPKNGGFLWNLISRSVEKILSFFT